MPPHQKPSAAWRKEKFDFGVVTTPFFLQKYHSFDDGKTDWNGFIAGDSFGELKGKKLDYSIHWKYAL